MRIRSVLIVRCVMSRVSVSIIAIVAMWGTIILQWLNIRDLKKQIENEKKWAEYWRESWLKERSRR